MPDIAGGILTILQSMRTILPNTKILLLSVLPRDGILNFDKIIALNAIIRSYQDGRDIFYLDMFNEFASDVWGSKFSLHV